MFISIDFVFDPAHRKYPQPAASSHYTTEGYGGKKRQCEMLFHAAADRLPYTIIRPCHIYGPGSQLGCLPLHGRDVDLIAKLRRGETLSLVGGGHFLQQPIFAADLAKIMIACAGNEKTTGKTYLTAGPDVIESKQYYEIIADHLGLPIKIHEAPLDAYLAEHPEHIAFLCHRIYDLSALKTDGLPTPATSITEGLKQHTDALLLKN